MNHLVNDRPFSQIPNLRQGVAKGLRKSMQSGDLAANLSFARVTAMHILSEDFLRLELQGDDLARFAEGALHFRLLRQRHADRPAVWPRRGEGGKPLWPDNDAQLVHRVYTGRQVDADRNRITVDIYRHAGGPTSDWALSNPVGERIGLIGPVGGGIPPGGWMLLAGDETAQPAILRMLETLPPETEGEALILAGAPGREGEVVNRTGIRLRWLYRDRGDDLSAAVRAVALPERDDSYLWFAASKSEARDIREYFRTSLGEDRSRCRASGYWG
ncbi:siderophore-interacting protein [Thalassovita mangrovi]|uniref:SIP domain-containing protein n=1 Tax=Thalassovita mangrovi TaxID=2692236 RepID=A0A6L8LNR3_9RHOB|nr:siderophore-interacting protein [Thalassovita mangrovi]MYM57515.1 SIP domain-containing protein [Thalassovita mangrovi]